MIPKNIIDDITDLHELVYAANCNIEQLKHSYELLIKDIIQFYNLPDIPIKFEIPPNKGAFGSYSSYTKDIIINPMFLDPTKMPNKQALDYYFSELIHTAFHETRHYLQYNFLRNKIDLPNTDILNQLSNDEKAIVLKELLNPATDDMLFINNGKIESFPFFYYSKFHEKDAVLTSIQYIKEIINNLEESIAQDLENGLNSSLKYWDKIYTQDTLLVAAQRDMKTYKTIKTPFNLINFPTNKDEIIDIAMHEYLPISEALTEFNLLKFNGLITESINLNQYNIDVSINNNTWFLVLSKPFSDSTLDFSIRIKGNKCCLFRADVLFEINQDKQNFKEIFDIAKAFAKVYSEINNNIVDTYIITPIIGIYPETDRQKLLFSVAKIEKLEYNEEPNTVFIKSQFKATNKTPYISELVSNIRNFILSKRLTLDEKLDNYEKSQVAHTIPKEIDDFLR